MIWMVEEAQHGTFLLWETPSELGFQVAEDSCALDNGGWVRCYHWSKQEDDVALEFLSEIDKGQEDSRLYNDSMSAIHLARKTLDFMPGQSPFNSDTISYDHL